MTQPTQEELLEEAQRFIRIADRDITAFKVLKNVPATHIATVCFHAQQAVEKSIKAVLILHGVELRRTHNLRQLVSMLSDINITPPVSSDELQKLNPYAVTFRYDDREIELLSRDDAENLVDTIRRWAGEQLNSSDSRTRTSS
jgi:HEPN domain-containing protein